MTTTPVTAITIRRATIDDRFAIADIHVRAWQTTYRGMMPDNYLASLHPEQRYDRWERDIQDDDGIMSVFVAETSLASQIVGFCSVCPQHHLASDDDVLPPAGELHTMYVDLAFKGGGVGRTLIERGEQRMREMGFTRAIVWMLADNHAAQAFYERMGYRADGITGLVPYGDRQVAEMRLAKSLTLESGKECTDDTNIGSSRHPG